MTRAWMQRLGIFAAGVAVGGAVRTAGIPSARAEARDAGGSSVGATGIGGVFFKAKEPKKITAWYVANLGFPPEKYGVHFEWRQKEDPQRPGSTTWSVFPESSTYFDPTVARYMINYRVADLDAVLARLRKAGAKVDAKIEKADYGRFSWAVDPEGNRFELWEPAAGF